MADPMLPDRIEGLLKEYEHAMDDWARLVAEHAGTWARFGPNGTAGPLQALGYEKLKSRQRQAFVRAGEKITESRLDEVVTSSKEWENFLRKVEEGRVQYQKEKAGIDRANFRVRLLAAKLRLHGMVLEAGAGTTDSGLIDDSE